MRASIAGRRVAHWATREQRLIHPRRPSRDAHIAALRAIAHLHAFDVALKPSRCRMSAGFTAYLSSSLMSVVQRRSSALVPHASVSLSEAAASRRTSANVA
jgi:hypothetical protein